ncbi:hypothetical protein HOLleu_19100 [Holothuria leucospilota]|uniref:Uncharacterized protein n=1 Tax=Holothuria leucospilota TaxID=206669 RepID=A0A9Q1H9Y1_HOLLE|nr:hypothetical protein HOLleu_19100 [Holothuria leucospilota]
MQQQYQPQQRQQLQWSQPLLQQAQNRTQTPLQQWVQLQRHPQPQALNNPPHSSGSTDVQQDPLPEPVRDPSSHSTGNVSDIFTQSYMVMLDPATKKTSRRGLPLQAGSSQLSGSLDALNQSVITQEERKDKRNNKNIERTRNVFLLSPRF